MVLYCWVCKQSNCSNQNLSFHRFPADAHEKAVWLEKLGLKEFTETVSKYARIRSIHFKGEAFEIKPSGKIFLRKGAFFNEEYNATTETASTSRLDNRKLFTDSTDTAPGTSCSDIIDSFGPPLKRFHSDTSATMTAPEIDTEYLSETLTASETELIQMSITEKETDRPTISQKKKNTHIENFFQIGHLCVRYARKKVGSSGKRECSLGNLFSAESRSPRGSEHSLLSLGDDIARIPALNNFIIAKVEERVQQNTINEPSGKRVKKEQFPSLPPTKDNPLQSSVSV
ncbi:hypothetical protein JTB14_004549 [Gonioctena quinquepunctata]|nr:hypothetical protein JTB14_004549 [Gonioctena quinquepunctata]